MFVATFGLIATVIAKRVFAFAINRPLQVAIRCCRWGIYIVVLVFVLAIMRQVARHHHILQLSFVVFAVVVINPAALVAGNVAANSQRLGLNFAFAAGDIQMRNRATVAAGIVTRKTRHQQLYLAIFFICQRATVTRGAVARKHTALNNKLTLVVNGPTRADLVYDDDVADLFLEPGMALEVKFKGNDLASSIRYKGKDHLNFEQWLTPTGPRTVSNRMKVKRFGIIVAHLDEVIRKLD